MLYSRSECNGKLDKPEAIISNIDRLVTDE